MLYQRLINLISACYLSLLAQFYHVVTATPVHVCVVHTQKQNLYFCILPILFQWRSFLTANSVTIFFFDHLAFSNQVHVYFYFFVWSYSDYHTIHQVVYHSNEVVI